MPKKTVEPKPCVYVVTYTFSDRYSRCCHSEYTKEIRAAFMSEEEAQDFLDSMRFITYKSKGEMKQRKNYDFNENEWEIEEVELG